MVTLADLAISDHLARIDVDGYTILEGAIEPDLVQTLRDTIRRLERELHVEPKGTAAEGHATRRMYNLLAKDPVFQAMPLHERAPDRRARARPRLPALGHDRDRHRAGRAPHSRCTATTS